MLMLASSHACHSLSTFVQVCSISQLQFNRLEYTYIMWQSCSFAQLGSIGSKSTKKIDEIGKLVY